MTLPVTLSTVVDNLPVSLGASASMTILYADGGNHGSFNENSLVVRLDLGPANPPDGRRRGGRPAESERTSNGEFHRGDVAGRCGQPTGRLHQHSRLRVVQRCLDKCPFRSSLIGPRSLSSPE